MPPMIQNNFSVRKNFGKLKRIIEVPNLIDIQKRSYDKFLQRDTPLESREDIGLQAVFKSVFPIKDFGETSSSSSSATASIARSTTRTSAAPVA
jgi:DNA-directed RNA polymerase subunit beta